MLPKSPPPPASRASAPARRSLPAALVWLAAALAGVPCGSPATSNGQPVTRQVVGPNGGTAATSNGRLKVLIPAGALKADVAITIQQVDSPAGGAIGQVYEIGPTGTP